MSSIASHTRVQSELQLEPYIASTREFDTDIEGNANILVIECCFDCKRHAWNTRHNEAKYVGYAKDLCTAVKVANPGTIVLFNQLPKKWYRNNLYY